MKNANDILKFIDSRTVWASLSGCLIVFLSCTSQLLEWDWPCKRIRTVLKSRLIRVIFWFESLV